MTRLKGASLTTILDAVEQAVAPEDRPILEEIDRQVEHYDEALTDDPYGHGIEAWLQLLQMGAAALPDRIPRSVLIAWRDGYKAHWGMSCQPWSPRPHWRCEDCHMVLPHIPWEGPCPVCGSGRVWHSDLSKPFGTAWIDPNATYRRTRE